MFDLVIFPFVLAWFGCVLKTWLEIIFADNLDVRRAAAKTARQESVSIERRQRFAIREKPCFHRLNHEEDLMIIQCWKPPVIANGEMTQRFGNYRFLRVNQQCANIASLAYPNLSLEFIERFISTAASDYSRLSAHRRKISAIDGETWRQPRRILSPSPPPSTKMIALTSDFPRSVRWPRGSQESTS